MDDPSPPDRWDPGEWDLWRLPTAAIVLVFGVEVGAVALVAAGAAVPTWDEVALAAFLTLLSVVHTELATGIERIRRRAADTSYFDLSSVWTFAAALLLPP
ncbi:MAG: GGDEF domain-containing protein, partial [Pseudonocardia sp.]